MAMPKPCVLTKNMLKPHVYYQPLLMIIQSHEQLILITINHYVYQNIQLDRWILLYSMLDSGCNYLHGNILPT
jgi:hypothetical protein